MRLANVVARVMRRATNDIESNGTFSIFNQIDWKELKLIDLLLKIFN